MLTPRRTHRRRRQRGVGTMEVLVASVLTLIIAFAIMAFFDAQERAYASITTYANSQNITRTVVDLMTREIRMSSYDPTVPSSGGALALYPGPSCPNVEQGLVVGMPQQIRIQQDLSGDGTINERNEDVTYRQVGNVIERVDNLNPPITVTLVENVPANGFRIRYYDNQGTPAELVPGGTPAALTQAQRACVQKVAILVESEIPDPYPDKPNLHSKVRSGVTIRNRWISTSY
jgi:hypothetical protein